MLERETSASFIPLCKIDSPAKNLTKFKCKKAAKVRDGTSKLFSATEGSHKYLMPTSCFTETLRKGKEIFLEPYEKRIELFFLRLKTFHKRFEARSIIIRVSFHLTSFAGGDFCLFTHISLHLTDIKKTFGS